MRCFHTLRKSVQYTALSEEISSVSYFQKHINETEVYFYAKLFEDLPHANSLTLSTDKTVQVQYLHLRLSTSAKM